LFWAAIIMFVISCKLVQFHCLDCGRTGWFSAARAHACHSVLERTNERRSGGLILGAGAQMRVWAWLLGIAALSYWFLVLARR
jgi:hypothetical protein